MSEKYNEYIKEHKENVKKGFDWLVSNLTNLFDDENFVKECSKLIEKHDESKYEVDEYIAYDNYFYGARGSSKSFQSLQNFNRAWLTHIHRNPHHWQYWILINDEPNKGEIILDMPDEYIIEMICDWWSFSWKKGDLTEIFGWYEERYSHIKFSDKTRQVVDAILALMKDKLAESETNGEN